MRGRVVDEQSQPIAGARVGLFGAFLPDADRSAIARTANDGTFTFLAHPRQKHLLWIEADGFAPRLLDGVSATAPAAIETVRLVRGAALSVSVDDPFAGQLQLVPRRVELGDNVTLELVRALWMRDVAPRVEWLSLPAGEYELLLRGGVPRSLLVLTLGVGDRKEQTLSVGPARGDATIHLEGEPLQDPVVTRWLGDRREEIAGRTDGATLTIPNGCIDGASYLIAGAQRFAVVRRLDASCSARAVVRRGSNRKVQLRWNRRKPPAHGAVAARDCGVEVPFAIAANGEASLMVPVGCSSSSIAVPGFAPVELRGDTAAYSLQEAASLLVRAVSREDGMPLGGATVLAFAASDLTDARLEDLSADRAKARAVASDDGWARLTVPAGDFLIGVARGRVPWLSEKYRAEVGRETLVDLEVPRPGSVNLRVALAPELAESGVRVVQVFLQPASGQRWPPRAVFGAQLRDAIARFEDVPPGKWLAASMIRMLDDPPMRGDSMEVEVHDGVATDATLDIKGLLFRGRIADDGTRLGRSMLITPDERGRKVTTAIDNNRRFVALLEKRGVYSVNLEVDDQETVVPEVRFDDPADEVEIRLPNGSIVGRVIDEKGNAVEKAMIRATALHESGTAELVQLDISAISIADGSFRFPRVGRGRWMLSAKTRTAESSRVAVDLGDGQAAGNVVLRLDEVRTATVKVVYENGAPVVGAKVSISAPPASVGDYGPSELVVTDADGRFRFRATSAFRNNVPRFAVTAADGTVASFRRALTDELTLVLPVVTGELVITITRGEWPPVPLHTWLVAEDGSIVGSRSGRVVTGSDGSPRFVIGRLVPGLWKLVAPSTPVEIHQVLSGNSGAVPALGVVRVVPGGSAEMKVDLHAKGG